MTTQVVGNMKWVNVMIEFHSNNVDMLQRAHHLLLGVQEHSDSLLPDVQQRLKEAVCMIDKALESPRATKDGMWRQNYERLGKIRELNKFDTMWAVKGVDDLWLDSHLRGSHLVDSVTGKQCVLPKDKLLTWFELWKQANWLDLMYNDEPKGCMKLIVSFAQRYNKIFVTMEY